ncbi:hypothetical protein [Lutimonas zeaxanthinifaciens]|uniref:hypothetical protein n=1 Tax=Lutimonas zeaxanthinifaciens TaxID=3060215 RepID=UPI00265CA045|nr:hypothetical protein [Lutimonas sp. YSD2104]WKK66458.1 hypothetical protein QZH61_02280 [Lutimonas sp. YSD2104]
MKTIKSISLLLLLSFWAVGIQAQDVGPQVNENYEKNWSFGAGFNVVDDSGLVIGGIADPSENWNFSMPFYISAEYYLNNQFSFMAMISTNKYLEGKVYNKGYIVGGDANYFSFDVNAKFSFRDIMKSYQFDPYVFLGFGYNSIGEFTYVLKEFPYDSLEHPAAGNLTVNGGLGFNYWFSPTWGMNLNLAAKWDANRQDGWNNHKQYSIGAVYFLN